MINLLSSGIANDLSWTENLHSNVVFGIAALIILALIGGKLIEIIKFPKVTGYILIGILIGPSVLGVLSHDMVEKFTLIRQIAIGFIGYTIGLELKFRKLKKTGKQVTIITLIQAGMTAIFVTAAVGAYLTVTDGDYIWTYAFILGAIATATAPGPIVAVVKNFRTKGPVTDVLLPLVALDDAIGIMLFAIMLSLGTTLLGISGAVSISAIILDPLLEIIISILIGLVLGLILSFIVKKFNRESDSMLLMMTLGIIFAGIGIGQVPIIMNFFGLHQTIYLSAILLPMTIGIVLTNQIDDAFEKRLTKNTDLFSAPILLGFFTLAGAELDLSALVTVGVVGLIYIMFRVFGKVLGAYTGAKLSHAPPTVTKYLGFTLIPQAGVAIDMALTTELRFKELAGFEMIGTNIMTIVLAATVIYEVLGLIVVKSALSRAGEIDGAKTGWSN
jgi:Kef-type K+ transport system membrane component KefB